MKMPKKLDKCPRTPECVAKTLYVDDDGELYRLDSKEGFVLHICHVRGSEQPKMAYLAEWYSNKTGRTRWVGPERMRKTVEHSPASLGFKRRGKDQQTEWVLKNVYVSELEWKPVE